MTYNLFSWQRVIKQIQACVTKRRDVVVRITVLFLAYAGLDFRYEDRLSWVKLLVFVPWTVVTFRLLLSTLQFLVHNHEAACNLCSAEPSLNEWRSRKGIYFGGNWRQDKSVEGISHVNEKIFGGSLESEWNFRHKNSVYESSLVRQRITGLEFGKWIMQASLLASQKILAWSVKYG
jgi:hypothetical protein